MALKEINNKFVGVFWLNFLPINKHAISSVILKFDESNFSAIKVQHEPTGSILIADELNKRETVYFWKKQFILF